MTPRAIAEQAVQVTLACAEHGVGYEHVKFAVAGDVEKLAREAFHAGFSAGLSAVDKFGEVHDTADESWEDYVKEKE